MKDELSSLRERLLKEYQDKRDELNRQQEEIRAANARLQADRQSIEEELQQRRMPSKPKWRCKRARTESESLGRFREQYEELERLRATAREAVVLAQTRIGSYPRTDSGRGCPEAIGSRFRAQRLRTETARASQ